MKRGIINAASEERRPDGSSSRRTRIDLDEKCAWVCAWMWSMGSRMLAEVEFWNRCILHGEFVTRASRWNMPARKPRARSCAGESYE